MTGEPSPCSLFCAQIPSDARPLHSEQRDTRSAPLPIRPPTSSRVGPPPASNSAYRPPMPHLRRERDEVEPASRAGSALLMRPEQAERLPSAAQRRMRAPHDSVRCRAGRCRVASRCGTLRGEADQGRHPAAIGRELLGSCAAGRGAQGRGGGAGRGTCAASPPQRRRLRARRRRRVARSRRARGKGSRSRGSARAAGLAMARAAPPARVASLGTRRGRGAAHGACGALQRCACRFAGTRAQRTRAGSRPGAARAAIGALAAAAARAAALAAAAAAAAVAAAAAGSCARESTPWWRSRRAHVERPPPARRGGDASAWAKGVVTCAGREHTSAVAYVAVGPRRYWVPAGSLERERRSLWTHGCPATSGPATRTSMWRRVCGRRRTERKRRAGDDGARRADLVFEFCRGFYHSPGLEPRPLP